MKVTQVRKGFPTLEEAQTFAAALAYREQFEIEEIRSGNLFDGPPLAYCVIPKSGNQRAAPAR